MTKMISRMMMLLVAGFLVAGPAAAECGMGHDGAKGEHSAHCTKPCCKKDKVNCAMHADKAECEKAGCHHKDGDSGSGATQNFGPKLRK